MKNIVKSKERLLNGKICCIRKKLLSEQVKKRGIENIKNFDILYIPSSLQYRIKAGRVTLLSCGRPSVLPT